MTKGRLFCALALITACVACDRLRDYTLTSPDANSCSLTEAPASNIML